MATPLFYCLVHNGGSQIKTFRVQVVIRDVDGGSHVVIWFLVLINAIFRWWVWVIVMIFWTLKESTFNFQEGRFSTRSQLSIGNGFIGQQEMTAPDVHRNRWKAFFSQLMLFWPMCCQDLSNKQKIGNSSFINLLMRTVELVDPNSPSSL